ncbi:MAG: 16S rRNA (cytosine(1402)-N(4))-methyltransferase RsmH [Clostridia bacterium]|nr:16S rRNA (cytosine(1402)-N(4))-methyltransferase RsmH [Clostridia bacterium]
MEFKHIPIMLNECIDNLKIKPDGVYVDATVGGAGHSSEIAKKLGESGVLIGIDKDKTAIDVSRERLSNAICKVILVNDDFKNILQILSELKYEKVDGILIDLGVSSHQIDEIDRGFSYKFDAPLDMRMDKSQSLTAFYVVNNYDEKTLVKILFEYGEESFARNIVRNILLSRKIKPIQTTNELVKIIEKSVPSKLLHKGGSVAKKTFQAIRIEVNGELTTLENVLDDMIFSLKNDGRLCVISFHSLEDRLVKNCFRLNATDCICPKELPICVCGHKASVKLITKKPLIPSEIEMNYNSRCSSSKLRVIEKL